jgi:hypothetical protein
MDNLKKLLGSIKTWCNDNGIAIFYGSVDYNAGTEVSWLRQSEDDWMKFLLVLERTGAKLLIVNIIYNDLEPDDPTIMEYKTNLESDDRIEYEQALKTLREHHGEIAGLNLSFIYNTACYTYSESPEWSEDYLTVQQAFAAQEDFEEYEGD